MKLVSIVTPCFNEEANVPEHFARVRAATAPFAGRYAFEHLYTDNASTDRTFELLAGLAAAHANVRVLRFSRDIGPNRAIACGLRHAQGDAAILIQADLQDPPELIPEFLRGWEEGYDVVYGLIRRRREGIVLRALRRLYYRLVAALADVPPARDAGEFRLASRRVLDAIALYTEDDLYLRGAIAHIGFRQLGVPYDRAARRGGRSSNSPAGLFRYAVNGLLSTTVAPIRAVTLAGLALAAVGFLLTAALVVRHYLLPGVAPHGFTTIASLVTFFAGAQLLAIGTIGEYIRKIHVQSLRRPRGFVQDALNIDPLPPDRPPGP